MSDPTGTVAIAMWFKNHPGAEISVEHLADMAEMTVDSAKAGIRRLIRLNWGIVRLGGGRYKCHIFGEMPVYGKKYATSSTPVLPKAEEPKAEEPTATLLLGQILEVVYVTRLGNLLAEGSDGKTYKLNLEVVA